MAERRIESNIPIGRSVHGGRLFGFRNRTNTLLIHLNRREICSELCSRIREMGYHIHGIWDASRALRVLKRNAFDLILLDARKNEADAWNVLIRINRVRPDIRVVVLLRARRWDSHVFALTLGATDCFCAASLSAWIHPLFDTYLPAF